MLGKRHGQVAHYLGQAGENLVAANLLRRGFNAARLPVDSGVDVVAHQPGRGGASHLVQIQVKTTSTRTCDFTLSTAKVTRYWRDCVNLVVVFWQDPAPLLVVMPPTTLYMYSSGNPSDATAPLRVVNGKVRFILRMTKAGGVYLRDKRWDLSPFVGAFRLLESLAHHPRAPEGTVFPPSSYL